MSLLPGGARAAHAKPLVPNLWYWEPIWCVERLIEEIAFTGLIHDPCCGSGRIPITGQKFGYEATSSDLIYGGYGQGGIDFFDDWTLRQTLIFNSPSPGRGKSRAPNLRDRFILHALEVAETVVTIVPAPYLCGRWHRDNLYRPYPPRLILACGDRPSMPPGGTDIKAKGGTTDYCWIVRKHGHTGPTQWRSI
jgi:hypothetical protein